MTTAAQVLYRLLADPAQLAHVLAEVRATELDDPTLRDHPRFSQHDDATAVLLLP